MLTKEVRNVVQVQVTKDEKNVPEVSVTMGRIPSPKQKYTSDLSARSFIWGDKPEEYAENWADLMVKIVRLALKDGLRKKDLPVPFETAERKNYRKVNNNLFITYAMTFNGASGYCKKITKALGKPKGFLKVAVKEGSTYSFP